MGRTPTTTLAVLSVALAIANPARADVVNLNPVKDNTLYQSATGSVSNGLGDFLFAGRVGLLGGGIPHRAVIAFDVAPQIPDGSVINSVELTLRMSRTALGTGAHTFSLHRLTKDWGEGTSEAGINEGMGAPSTNGDATWIHNFFNVNELLASFWTNAGGDFVAAPSASTVVGVVELYTWGSNVGLVTDVQDWLDGNQPDYGWILIGNELVFPTSKRFDSGDNNELGGVLPVLTIDFTPPPCAADNECDDSDVCTTDTCVNTACVNTPIPTCCNTNNDCDDSDVCTTDTCVNNACSNVSIPTCCNTDGDCDNGEFCDGAEQCVANQCQNGIPPAIDDGVSCTVDACDELNDLITNTANDANCDNGAFCDGAEICDPVLDCQVGIDPCIPVLEVCDEINDICLADCSANTTAARSCAQHGCGRLCLDLFANNIEPRAVGTTDLEIDFAAGTAPASPSVGSIDCTDNGGAVTSHTASGSASVLGDTVTVTFSPALPDENACVITMDCGASVCIRMLQGDINQSGSVTTGDFGAVRFEFNKTACEAGTPTVDFNTVNGVTTGDASGVRFFFTNTVPACP